uniref:Uncharacterized protein n=1 Tax=Anguilla anguilla TaxID=7936 RepID=A0A0E9QG35_ANGAN
MEPSALTERGSR